MNAIFDMDDIAVAAGWATYHQDNAAHPHVAAPEPTPCNGHSPSNYVRCMCGAFLKWFVVGQHRYGSIGRSA